MTAANDANAAAGERTREPNTDLSTDSSLEKFRRPISRDAGRRKVVVFGI